MGSFDVRQAAPIFAAGVLAALAIGGCGVESTAPPALTNPPGLKPQSNTDAGCLGPEVAPDYIDLCTPAPQPRCCCDTTACTYFCCGNANQRCVQPNTCTLACDAGSDCLAMDPSGGLLCQGGLCRPPGCKSNNDCAPDSGLVCQEDLGVCVRPLTEEGNPPGCSAASAGAGGGALVSVLVALALAIARRRAR